jgi:hypothetical protein
MAPQAAAEAAVSELREGSGEALRLSLHDLSRLEWMVFVPLPQGKKLPYRIEVTLEVPTSAGERRSPWDQLQAFTRLDGPRDVATSDDRTVDTLRRGAVTLSQMLARARDGFLRHCRSATQSPALAAQSLERSAAGPSGEGKETGFLMIWLSAALRAVEETRSRLTRGEPGDTQHVLRERKLIDEFASVRLLEMLGETERAAEEAAAAARGQEPLQRTLEQVRARAARALLDEFDHRRAQGFAAPVARDPSALERYVARTAQLRRHFEEVLFLDRETSQLDERVQRFTAAFAALLGGAVAFLPLQILLARSGAARAELGWSAAVLALLAGLCYVARDRIRDFAHAWITGKVYRFHAQRLMRASVPARRLATRDVIVRAQEWCTQTTSSRPDALTPEGGASLPITLVEYVHRGVVLPQAALAAAGVDRVRHIFRYDFSPLFSRLHDEPKPVPVLEDGAVRFVAAQRRYHVPVSIRLSCAGAVHEERATVVLEKGGLVRLDWRGR